MPLPFISPSQPVPLWPVFVLPGTTLNAGGGVVPYPSTRFDGSTRLSRADFTGNADSKVGILSAWLKLNGADNTRIFLLNNEAGYFGLERQADNTLRVVAFAADGVTFAILAPTIGTYKVSNGWFHFLASWDLAASRVQFYLNDAADIAGGATITNVAIDYTRIGWFVGSSAVPDKLWNGDVAEFYFNPAATLDLSVAANRRKFRSAAGRPVDLGPSGALPTGVAPLMYLKGGASTFAGNSGTGGAFTTAAGALIDGSLVT